MTGLFSILLAAVVPVTPVAANTWIVSKEHPKTTLLVSERGGVAYTIDVSPDGALLRCETPEKTGLDRKICEILTKNARFLPAKDDQGNPLFGVYDGFANFALPGKDRRQDRSKLAITVDRLPEGVTSPAYARVAFLVDGAGAISQCASTTGERRRFMQTVESLGPAACDKVMKEYRPAPVRNAAGDPVPSVQTVTVRFETPATP
jgi:hypothetical protein